jgi:CheY-like chemotaxis protein
MSKLLVVDDDPDILALVQLRLQRAGHRVLGASSGAEALAIVAERGTPDLAVLDVSMPGMSGLELLTTLREQQGQDVPAVFLSARVQPEDIQRGRSLGATYLTKPFVASALLNAVERELVEAGAGTSGW